MKTLSERSQKKKASLTPKRKKFARTFVKTGNATEAYRQSYDAGNMSPRAINTEAVRTLAKPAVQSEVARLMADSGFEMADVVAIHKRNIAQSKHLPTSQRAVETYYELEGILRKDNTPSLKVAFVIHTEKVIPTDTPSSKTHE